VRARRFHKGGCEKSTKQLFWTWAETSSFLPVSFDSAGLVPALTTHVGPPLRARSAARTNMHDSSLSVAHVARERVSTTTRLTRLGLRARSGGARAALHRKMEHTHDGSGGAPGVARLIECMRSGRIGGAIWCVASALRALLIH
jgi:hypothetical protein